MSRPELSGPAWRSVLLADGPDDGLAEETAWWEARMAADVSGDADQVYVMIGATAEVGVNVLVLTYTDERGATYRVTFG